MKTICNIIFASAVLFLAANAGEISFAPYVAIPTDGPPEVVAIGDVNNDGLKDVVIGASSHFDTMNVYNLFVFIQTTGGVLNTPVRYDGCNIEAIDIADLNGDTMSDIVVGTADSIAIFIQDSTGLLYNAGNYYSGNDVDGVKTGDFNHDGLTDVVACHWNSDFIRVFYQQPYGDFSQSQCYAINAGGYDEISAGDVNGDGLDDIVFMRGQGYNENISIFLQDTSGNIQTPVFYDLGDTSTCGLAVGDVNNDGKKDVVVTISGNMPDAQIAVWLQDTDGSLQTPPCLYSCYQCPTPVEIADFDQDGRNDIAVGNDSWEALSIYQQNGLGMMMPYDTTTTPDPSYYKPQGLAVGDINGDNKPDITLADGSNGLVILYNTSATGVSGEQAGKVEHNYALKLKIAGNKISYRLPQSGTASLKVYNLLGQEVNTLVRENKTAGSYKINWDSRDDSGRRVSSGVYLVRLEANGQAATGKMLVVR
ncbi:MAG: FG-GAP-like repeat-containing protein [bacterium]|nr:FG-GAP-like repeat-containing protein [bacterium]